MLIKGQCREAPPLACFGDICYWLANVWTVRSLYWKIIVEQYILLFNFGLLVECGDAIMCF